MFGKIKRYLGIEGVKVELDIPQEISEKAGEVKGKVRFYSMHDQVVNKIEIKMIEKYRRGRRKGKLVDEFLLGEISMEREVRVEADIPVEIEFTLPFHTVKSSVDILADKNIVARPFVGVAKFLKNVKSRFRIVAEVGVKGTALNPFDQKEIRIT